MTASRDPQLGSPAGLTGAGRMRFLARDAAFYGLAAITNKAFFLITLPLLTRYFGVDRYGSIDFLYVLVLFLTAVVVLGQDSAVARYFWDDDDAERRKQVVSQSLVMQVAVSVGVTALLLVVARSGGLDFEVADSRLVLTLVVLHVPFMLLLNFEQGLLKWTFSRLPFATVTVGQTALNAALLVAAVVQANLDVAGVFAISLASRALFAVIGLFFCRRWLTRPRLPSHLPKLLTFGVPFGIIGAVGTFVPVVERGTASTLLGAVALSQYAAGATIALIISLPIQAFQMAWGPFALAIHRSPDAARSYDQIFKAFTVLCCLAVIGLVTLAPFLLLVLAGRDFVGGAVVVPALGLALAIQGISWISEIGITLSKRAYLQLPAYAAFLAVGAVAMWVLAVPFGLAGVAVGVLAGYVAKAVVATRLGQRAYPLPWSYAPVVLLIVITAVLALTVAVIGDAYGPFAAVPLGIAGAGALVVIAWNRVFASDERAKLRTALQAARRGFGARA